MHDDHISTPKVILPESAQSRTKFRLLIDKRLSRRLRHSERILHNTNQLVMIDISSCHNVDVIADVVAIVVLLDHISADGLHIFDISQDGEADLLFLEYASVGDL